MKDSCNRLATLISALCLILFISGCSANDNKDTLHSLYFPHIASNTKWDTEVCLINTSGINPLKGTLTAFSDSGAQTSQKAVELAPHARVQFIVSTDFTSPEGIGYMIFKADAPDVAGYMKFYIESNYRGAIPAVARINTGSLSIPHIASNKKWWTGLSLLNTTNRPKTLTFEFNDGTTLTRTIDPNEHQKFSIKSLFPQAPRPDIKSGMITGTSGVIGLMLIGSNPGVGNRYLGGMLLTDQTDTDLYFPHIARFKKWWTGIIVYNPSSSPARLTIAPYRANGNPLPPQTIDVAPETKYQKAAKDMKFEPGTAWFRVSSDQAVTGLEIFGTKDHKRLGGYACVNISKSRGVFPKLEKQGMTGIALVNIQDKPVTVTLEAFTDSGEKIASRSYPLNPHQKLISPAQSLLPDDISSATYIGYWATHPVVGFQLNSSKDGMLLDALPGL
ncbi:MAG: hypothetical protein D3926_11325 [Desulfobacteraceae bacterium]|nr:MAG: hypothetical protein D3926_11325 [Desulfobacteraceae bacterium]